MVSAASYRIIKKAVIIRIGQGEDVNEVIASYPKLSDKQKAQLLTELADEGYLNTDKPEEEPAE